MGDYLVQFNDAVHEYNHGNHVFFRDLCITDFRDMAKSTSICLVQFDGTQHTVGQGGWALS
jgi:hypothetical protein